MITRDLTPILRAFGLSGWKRYAKLYVGYWLDTHSREVLIVFHLDG